MLAQFIHNRKTSDTMGRWVGEKLVKRTETCNTSNRCILPLKNMNREEFG